MKGTLYLIPTVLSEGRTESLSPQVYNIISSLDYFLVENIRTARRFISSLNTGQVIADLQFRQVDKDTSPQEIDLALQPVREGRSAGIISEAGCPGIADPGSRLVAGAHAANIRVIPIPGPSSIFLALMASGFNGQKFTFHGYLPIENKKREDAIRSIEKEALQGGATQIFIETPYRNRQLLSAIISVCKTSTRLCIARDITGPKEWIYETSVGNWKKVDPELHKIPCVFLISGS